jgi:hypothetical protein
VKRLLLAAALGAGLLGTASAPAANACEFSQCPWGRVVCSVVSCPVACPTVAGQRHCLLP